ncbi:MAG: DNA mismatch repair protein MutT, partial [Clostridia bacterium]|nr:DNA mismatch repair protein MutT [Clostridia bacterium]
AGELADCDEGVLEWIDKARLRTLPMWEGDKIFLDLIDKPRPFFSLKLRYSGEVLSEAVLNGKPIPLPD